MLAAFNVKQRTNFNQMEAVVQKHLLRYVCPKVPSTSEHHHDGPLDKLLKSKTMTQVTINSKDFSRIKNELTKEGTSSTVKSLFACDYCYSSGLNE